MEWGMGGLCMSGMTLQMLLRHRGARAGKKVSGLWGRVPGGGAACGSGMVQQGSHVCGVAVGQVMGTGFPHAVLNLSLPVPCAVFPFPCEVDPSVFEVPQGYTVLGAGRNEPMRDEDDDLLQFAIQQSLLDAGTETDQVGWGAKAVTSAGNMALEYELT